MNNTLFDYILSLLIFLVSCLVIRVINQIVLKYLKGWTKKTATTIDDFLVGAIEKVALPLLYCGALYVGIVMLSLNPSVRKSLNMVFLAVLTLYVVRLVTILLTYVFKVYWLRRGKDMSLERSLTGILNVIKILVWTLAVVFYLDNAGFQISSVIAGLGIGGVAVALAAQAVLGDLFSYFSIILDRPFEIGDFIIIGDYMGTIEHIGIKTTRIRSLGGEQVIFSNSDLTNARVRNYKRMQKRRVVFKFGIVYQTTLEQLKAVPGTVERAIKSIKDTVFDRAHFFSYGDFSLDFEVVYYVLSSDYNKYMDIQQEINLVLKEELEKSGIEFAYPTQTLFVEKQKG